MGVRHSCSKSGTKPLEAEACSIRGSRHMRLVVSRSSVARLDVLTNASKAEEQYTAMFKYVQDSRPMRGIKPGLRAPMPLMSFRNVCVPKCLSFGKSGRESASVNCGR